MGSRPPISSNPLVISPGGTTSEAMISSCSLSCNSVNPLTPALDKAFKDFDRASSRFDFDGSREEMTYCREMI